MGDIEHCVKHNVDFPSKYWCPMCLQDEMDADMETLNFKVTVSKEELLEFLNNYAQGGVDVYGQLPENESIQISIKARDRYSDVEFELSYIVMLSLNYLTMQNNK